MPLGAFCIIHLRKKDPLGLLPPHLLIMMNGRLFVNRERYSDFKLEIVCHHFTFIYDTSRKWAVHNGAFKHVWENGLNCMEINQKLLSNEVWEYLNF